MVKEAHLRRAIPLTERKVPQAGGTAAYCGEETFLGVRRRRSGNGFPCWNDEIRTG